MGVTGGEGSPGRGLVNMEEVLRILSPLNPLSPQGVDARGRAAGEPGLGGARVEGRESGGPEAPADGAALRFVARASPNATEPGHAPPGRVALRDRPAHLALINRDAAPAVPQPIRASPYLHATLNVSSAPYAKYMPGSSAEAGPVCKCEGCARVRAHIQADRQTHAQTHKYTHTHIYIHTERHARSNRFSESLCDNCVCFGCWCGGVCVHT